MGKSAMCLQMLQILNSGKVYKCSDLAYLLETNSRNIIEYKKELEEAGYYITSIPGKYGGYKLEQTTVIPSLKFTQKEIDCLTFSSIFLTKYALFPEKKQYELAISKIFSTIKHQPIKNEIYVINKEPFVMDDDDLANRFSVVGKAIAEKKKMILKYFIDYDKIHETTFNPYDMFLYDDMWYVIGWDEVLCDISVVKLHLISLCDMLADKFVIYKYYNIHDYIDEYGFKKDNDWQHIKLKINNNLLMNFKERVYGKNLKITRTRGKTSTVDLDMVNKKDILNLVLEFGKDVVVLEPSWLIDELLSYQEYILKTYKK